MMYVRYCCNFGFKILGRNTQIDFFQYNERPHQLLCSLKHLAIALHYVENIKMLLSQSRKANTCTCFQTLAYTLCYKHFFIFIFLVCLPSHRLVYTYIK